MPRELCLKTGCSYHLSGQDKGDTQYIYKNEGLVALNKLFMVCSSSFITFVVYLSFNHQRIKSMFNIVNLAKIIIFFHKTTGLYNCAKNGETWVKNISTFETTQMVLDTNNIRNIKILF